MLDGMIAGSSEQTHLEQTRSLVTPHVYRIAPTLSAAMMAAVAHVARAIPDNPVMRANVSAYRPAMERFVAPTAVEVAVAIAPMVRAAMLSANALVNVFQPVKERPVVQTVVVAHVAPALPNNPAIPLDNAKLPPVVVR